MRCAQGVRAGLAAMALILLAAACNPAGIFASKPRGNLRVATSEPTTLDPLFASQPAEALVAKQLFDGLVRYDDTTAAVVPDVASSWDVNADNTRFTFHLRRGPHFSNGEPVTAASFVRGLTRALSPGLHAAAGSLGYEVDGIAGAAAVSSGASSVLTGVQAVDDRTLVIHLSSPDAEFLIRCAGFGFLPLPSDAAMAAQRPSWGENPIGNGPFKLAGAAAGQPGWVHNQSITVVPNPLRAPGRVNVGRVTLTIFPTVDAAYAAWQAGRLDWSPFPASATSAVLALGRRQYVTRPTAGFAYLAVTGTVGASPPSPTATEQFDTALSLAVDRAHIIASVFGGIGKAAVGIVPPMVPGAASDAGASPCGACTFDPVRARQALASSGVRVPGAFPVLYAAGSGEEAWVEALAEDLRANLGLQAVATPLGPHAAGGLAAMVVTRGMRAPIPDDVLADVLGPGPENLTGYANPAMAALLARAGALADPVERGEVFQQAEGLALKDLPIVPLLWPKEVRLARLSRWSGLSMDAFGDPTTRSVVPG